MCTSPAFKEPEARVSALLRDEQAVNDHGKVENRRRALIYKPAFESAVGPAFEMALTKES